MAEADGNEAKEGKTPVFTTFRAGKPVFAVYRGMGQGFCLGLKTPPGKGETVL
jgi:hypothetical protein